MAQAKVWLPSVGLAVTVAAAFAFAVQGLPLTSGSLTQFLALVGVFLGVFEQRSNGSDGLQGEKLRRLFRYLLFVKDNVWLPGVGVAMIGAIGLGFPPDLAWGSAARFLTASAVLYSVVHGVLQARSEPTLTDLIADLKTGTVIPRYPTSDRFHSVRHSDPTRRFKTRRPPFGPRRPGW